MIQKLYDKVHNSFIITDSYDITPTAGGFLHKVKREFLSYLSYSVVDNLTARAQLDDSNIVTYSLQSYDTCYSYIILNTNTKISRLLLNNIYISDFESFLHNKSRNFYSFLIVADTINFSQKDKFLFEVSFDLILAAKTFTKDTYLTNFNNNASFISIVISYLQNNFIDVRNVKTFLKENEDAFYVLYKCSTTIENV